MSTNIYSKEKQYNFVYKTTNLLNGMIYIGKHSTDNIDDGYIGSGGDFCIDLYELGRENFEREILSYHDTSDEAYDAEAEIVTKEFIQEETNYNKVTGGKRGWHYHGIQNVKVKDKDGNTYSVAPNDPRYLSGELVHHNTGKVLVKDKEGNTFKVNIDDPRYLSGELVGMMKGTVTVRDSKGIKSRVSNDDPRYLSGELVPVTKGMVSVKDKDGNGMHVSVNDPRYLSGELVSINRGMQHDEKFKAKCSERSKGMVNVRDRQGNTFRTSVNNPDYISGELIFAGKKNVEGFIYK